MHVSECSTGQVLRSHTVEGFLVLSVQVLTQLSAGVQNQGTIRIHMGAATGKLACEDHPVIALVPCPPESRHPLTGVDEPNRQRDPALPEEGETDKVGTVVEVCHLSGSTCLQRWGGHPGPQEIPTIFLPVSKVVPCLQQDV